VTTRGVADSLSGVLSWAVRVLEPDSRTRPLGKYRSAARLPRNFLLRVPSSRTPYNHLQKAAPCGDRLVELIAAAFKSKKRRHRGLSVLKQVANSTGSLAPYWLSSTDSM